MSADPDIVAHYARDGLETAIRDGLAAAGGDLDNLMPADLSPVDEFHLGWRSATEALVDALQLDANARVLDIGCGLGGPARHFTDATGCHVTGIDLTPDYVALARTLTAWCGLSSRCEFRQGSALDLPFGRSSFDVATLIHVGMNISDKARLFAEMRRVLKPGGRAGIYDVMRVGAGDPAYPTPWAASAATSFLASPGVYTTQLSAAGFEIVLQTDRSTLAMEVARAASERTGRDGLAPLGLHLLMGDGAQPRLGNLMRAVSGGIVAPVEIVARAI